MIAVVYDVNFWIQFGAGVAVVVGGLTGGAKMVHTWLTQSVAERLEDIRAETKPNGGGSMRDAIDRIDSRSATMEHEMQSLRSEIDRHLGFHDGLRHVD